MLNGSVGKELLVHCWCEVKGYKLEKSKAVSKETNMYLPCPAILSLSQKTAWQVGVQVHASNPSA